MNRKWKSAGQKEEHVNKSKIEEKKRRNENEMKVKLKRKPFTEERKEENPV